MFQWKMSNIFIGTSGYNYYGWINNFYPTNIKSSEMFNYYTKFFNTVEINYSFYHTPTEKTILKWYNTAPSNFKYTLKVPKKITHIKRFHDCSDLIENFNKLSLLLKEKIGTLLFQMPPSFKPTDENLKRIENVFKLLNPNLNYAIEFRNNQWFENKEILELCKKFNVAFCIVSAPKLKFLPVATSKNVYIRLHGKDRWYNYDYSDKELKDLSSIISQFLKSKNIVWVYFNNDVNSYAPKNALKLIQLLKK